MQPSKRIFTRLMLSYLLVTLAVLLIVGFVFIYLMQKYLFRIEGWQLADRGQRVTELLNRPLYERDTVTLMRLTDALAFSYDVYLWVIDNKGLMVATSGANPHKLGLGVEEMEIEHVLAGNTISKQITGPEFNSLLYLAPILEPRPEEKAGGNGEDDEQANSEEEPPPVIGVLAISSPLGPVTNTIAEVTRLGLYAVFGAVLLALVAAFTLSRGIAHPLEEMSKVAQALSQGNFEKRVKYRSQDELGHLAETLNYAIERISGTIEEQRRLVKLQQDFISDISHELRAPLTSLQGFLELMREGRLKEEEHHKYLEIMYRDTMHLSRLVQDLLELARLESHQISLDRQPLAPGELLREACQYWQVKAADQGVRLEIGETAEAPPVFADSGRLYQVLANLLENAVRYTPRGGAVRLSCTEQDGGLLFTVADGGNGIPKEELPLIWNRFHKVDKARTRSDTGTGLGLSIVKQIVELHGGWVRAESEAGRGSRFMFWLPSC